MRRRRVDMEGMNIAEIFRNIHADYDAAKASKFHRRVQGLPPQGGGADYHVRNWLDNLKLMELVRHLDRNDVVFGQGVTRLIDNVLQDGVKLDPQTGDPELDSAITRKWEEWSNTPELCDLTGEHDLHAQARMGLRATIIDGDVFFLPNEGGSLQGVEAHRVRTPHNTKRDVVFGVLMDQNRRRLEYWITKEDLNPLRQLMKVSDIEPIPARAKNGNRMVFHVYDPRRLSQTRGITALACIVNTTGMHDDLQFTNLVRAQVCSSFAIIEEQAAGTLPTGKPTSIGGAVTNETLSDGGSRTVEGVGPGMRLSAGPGRTIKGFSPNVPNPEFFPHAKLLLTFVAVNLGIPVSVLLLDPSDTNFSGWRGAMDQARTGFKRIQRWMIARFYEPVYLWRLRNWIAEDNELRKLSAKDGVDVLAHAWTPPGFAYIEPFKDAKADETRLANGLSSLRRVHAERGRDWDVVQREIVEDRAKLVRTAIEAAAEIKTEFADADVSWRDLAPGFAKTIASQNDDSDGDDNKDNDGATKKKKGDDDDE